MSRVKSWLSRIVWMASLLAATGAAVAQPVKTDHLESELVSQGELVPGQTGYVALRQVIEPEWHTYWVNPGDAGEPTKITWTLPPGWSASEILWPVPTRLTYGPLMNFGYSDEVLLPVAITPPADARAGEVARLTAKATFMVCSDQCIPGEADLAIDVKVAGASPVIDATWSPKITAALAKGARAGEISAAATAREGGLTLSMTGDMIRGGDFPQAFFFPFKGTSINYAAPQPIERGPEGLTLTLTTHEPWDGADINGVLTIGEEAFEVSAASGPALPGAAGLGTLPPAPVPGSDVKTPAGDPGSTGLLLSLLFAFAGGLILNLMPCVFPVLSMKAASLAAHAHEARAARRQGAAFLAGCLFTFLALAALLIALRTAGSAIGWGFHLQSPPVTAALALLMLLVALDLSGVFEIGTSVQGAGSGLTQKGGAAGSFFTGALAVVVAAPCTAPFMGPALAYALSQPAPVALAVFAALGLGFAAPFTALAFIPALQRRIPRPGAWMNVFKTVLSFPMYGAAAWLAWVFSGQAGHLALGVLLVAALLTAFGAWLFGQGQRQFTPVRRWMLQAGLPIALIVAAVALTPVAKTEVAVADAGAASSQAAIPHEPWSPERVAQLQAEGRPVFVDFTADWCITCKVNESTALASVSVAEAFTKANAAYLVADWTNRDDIIAAALDEHGRVGVPLYLVYGKDGGPPQVLPQILTSGLVKAALEKAAG